MRCIALLASTTALLLSAPNVSAQAKANFAGTWTMVPDPNAPAPAGRGGFGGLGQSVTIAQDAKTLTITRTTQNGEIKSVYNLDGSDSKNTITMGGNSIDQMSKASWEGNSLVVNTTTNFNGNERKSTLNLSLDASGNLVVKSTSPGRGGGEPVTTTTTYKKS